MYTNRQKVYISEQRSAAQTNNLCDKPRHQETDNTLQETGEGIASADRRNPFLGQYTSPQQTTMATVEILKIPLGSALVSTISGNDPADKNDFDVLLLFSENVNLTQSGVSVSTGSRIVAVAGANAVYQITIRPPQTSGTVRVTVAANAADKGNPATHKDIRVSTGFADADAEVPTPLFGAGIGIGQSPKITVSPTRIFTAAGQTLKIWTHQGTQQSTKTLPAQGGIDYFNNTLLGANGTKRYSLDDVSEIDSYALTAGPVAHTRLGVLTYTHRQEQRTLNIQPYGKTNVIQQQRQAADFRRWRAIAHQADLLYFLDTGAGDPDTPIGIAEITAADTISFLKLLNIKTKDSNNRPFRDAAIYQDTMFLISDGTATGSGVHTLDIRKYRPIAKNTKSTVYPIFAAVGETVDLQSVSPDAERIVFDVGYDKPSSLSINANNQLVVGSGAETCFVKLKAINRIDATETGSFQFYLIIRQAAAPVWRPVTELTMRAGSRYDLRQLVEGADSITFKTGGTRPAGSTLSAGIFSIGTVGGLVEFTATKGTLLSSHIAITINIIQEVAALADAKGFRYRVEIAGRDVTADLVGFPSVSETLDPVVINEYRVNDASLVLRNEAGRYNSDTAGNFWETHGLNPGGFQNAIKIYTVHFDRDGHTVENLLFSGVILESSEPLQRATFKLNCVDISSQLHKALVQAFGTFEKWDTLRKQSDTDSYEGIYLPEASLAPMQVGTGTARSDRTDLRIQRLALPSEGLAPANTGYLTPTTLRTAGGFLPVDPLGRFNAEPRSEDVRSLINQLAINKEIYNTEIDIPGVEVDAPFLLNRGSVAFSVEQTRTTRVPVDWVYDSTQNRVLLLLSNPEGHLSDLLVESDLDSGTSRVLHAFDRGGTGIVVHRIERRNSNTYYILASAKISQDRSAPELPRPDDRTGYASDSLTEGSAIQIYQCVLGTPTPTVTEHVAEDDSYPPQLGIHYWVGFENSVYSDAFEGTVPNYRGAFKWQSGNLYYRYAKEGEFGVARVNTGGTTTKMVGTSALDNFQNHLNFAFDINSSGTLYFAYATGDATGSTLAIQRRTADGTVTTVLQDRKAFRDLTVLNPDGGAYLGVQECLFHRNQLYLLVPIQQPIVANQPLLRFTTANRSPGDAILSSVERVNTGDLSPGDIVSLNLKWNQIVNGLNAAEITVTGATVLSLARSRLTEYALRIRLDASLSDVAIRIPADTLTPGNGDIDITLSFRQREPSQSAGMALYRCDVTAGSPSLTAIHTWDFVHRAGCNLTVHDGNVHYAEHPSVATVFKPINPDLMTYDAQKGYNRLPESLGALKKVTNAGEVEHLGAVWYTDRPYNVFPTRMLSIADALHLCAGYGTLDALLRYNSPASGADNMAHIVYGQTLHYVLPRFHASGSIYANLARLAKNVNATVSFERNIIRIADRRPYRAMTDGATGTGTANIGFSDANKPFPSNGYLRIGNEILRYTGLSGGVFTGVERGVLGSAIENHADNSEVLYLDAVIQAQRLGSPYKAITLQADVNRIFNVIRDSAGIAEVRDADSIAKYGERPYTLDLGLTRHENAWIEHVFAAYLEELKDLQQIVNIQVVPNFSGRLGQIVPFFYDGQLKAMRVLSIRYEREATHLKGRTVAFTVSAPVRESLGAGEQRFLSDGHENFYGTGH